MVVSAGKEKMQSILYLCPIGNVLMKNLGMQRNYGILGKVYRVVIDRNYNIIKERNSMMETPKVFESEYKVFALYYGKMNP